MAKTIKGEVTENISTRIHQMAHLMGLSVPTLVGDMLEDQLDALEHQYHRWQLDPSTTDKFKNGLTKDEEIEAIYANALGRK